MFPFIIICNDDFTFFDHLLEKHIQWHNHRHPHRHRRSDQWILFRHHEQKNWSNKKLYRPSRCTLWNRATTQEYRFGMCQTIHSFTITNRYYCFIRQNFSLCFKTYFSHEFRSISTRNFQVILFKNVSALMANGVSNRFQFREKKHVKWTFFSKCLKSFRINRLSSASHTHFYCWLADCVTSSVYQLNRSRK